MLVNFIKVLHQGDFDSQMAVLDYLKAHRLIDTLILSCIRSRI